MYADIIVDITHEKLDRPFRYRIPDELEDAVSVGCQVVVPFGAANKLITGYCIGISHETDYDPSKIKNIIEVKAGSVSIESRQILLADFLKRRYGVTMIQALKTVLPVKQSVKGLVQKSIQRGQSVEALRAYYESVKDKGNQKAKARLIEQLLVRESLAFEEVTGRLNISSSTLKLLEEAGLIEIKITNKYRNPVQIAQIEADGFALSPEQRYIVETVTSEQQGKYYIHGITGSGKTAVYIELIAETLKRGRQAIVLIPEISLTYQTLRRFYARFGDKVSVINSTLSQGEKYDQIRRAMAGDIQVIIGPRSALFTPFPDLGLVIMDEEHETSYKSEQSPKYHAREVAEEVARLNGASLVLGSATPSMEAYYRVKQGEFMLFRLDKRLTGGQLPSVEVVDLREELRNGNRSIFSLSLQEKLKQRLERKEQSILFLNRRGYSGFISCRSCGHVMRCPHCSVSLSQHGDGKLHCHYCGYTIPNVKLCPSCGSKYILGFKVGTQQIEEKLKELLPGVRVLRMDADTTRTKDSYERILSAFANGEADVLVGTQMIVKGHDFPRVTLVGVLAADLSLSFGDFRSGERTFQLLTQAAGRAGRGELPGEVVIQTYQPEHYSVQYAAAQDFAGFYEEEMQYRELMGYPPVGRMMAIQFFGADEPRVKALAEDFSDYLKFLTKGKSHIQVLGATPAAISKVKDVYRYVIYVKASRPEILMILKNALEERRITKHSGQEIVQYDFDPVNMF
ncbi:MAG: primosomal protein N' [Lachnospiraceae bacterium]|nr:primosomal protein N' [Lachnospiraceae bacterium]